MGVFTAQKMTISRNRVAKVNRQPVSSYELVREDPLDPTSPALVIPCRVTGTDDGNVKLFVLKKYYDRIPGGLFKNDQITVDGYVQPYVITRNPIWAGGTQHHIEAPLEEMV